MEDPDSEDIFTRIYRSNEWGDIESRSGPGSTVFRTRLLRPRLADLFSRLGVHSLLDLPCGDFNWMRLMELPSVDYLGGDVVPALIDRNISRYARPGRRFVLMDMRHDALPEVDLILCRDGLVHFSFSDIALAIRSMKQSGSTYLLATSFTGHAKNEDSHTGGWRPLNLSLPPLCFPAPLDIVADGPRPDGTCPDKSLCLYRLSVLPLEFTGETPQYGESPCDGYKIPPISPTS